MSRKPRPVHFFTTYWQWPYWRADINAEYEPLNACGSNQYRSRGVSSGDIVYVVSVGKGLLPQIIAAWIQLSSPAIARTITSFRVIALASLHTRRSMFSIRAGVAFQGGHL